VCAFMARALWREMLDVMHEGDPYGHLAAGGEAIEPEELSRLVGLEVSQVDAGLKELERRKVFSRTENGIIFCRRMVRDEAKRSLHAEAGKMGGNPNLVVKRKVKPKVKTEDKGLFESQGNQKPTPSVAVASSPSEPTTPDASAPERVYAFMGEMRPVWQQAYGGAIPPGTAKRLKPLVDQFGSAEVAMRLANYLAATDAQFASIVRFVSTYGHWGSAKQNGSHRVDQNVKRGYV
jgi:hypothetical protein